MYGYVQAVVWFLKCFISRTIQFGPVGWDSTSYNFDLDLTCVWFDGRVFDKLELGFNKTIKFTNKVLNSLDTDSKWLTSKNQICLDESLCT